MMTSMVFKVLVTLLSFLVTLDCDTFELSLEVEDTTALDLWIRLQIAAGYCDGTSDICETQWHYIGPISTAGAHTYSFEDTPSPSYDAARFFIGAYGSNDQNVGSQFNILSARTIPTDNWASWNVPNNKYTFSCTVACCVLYVNCAYDYYKWITNDTTCEDPKLFESDRAPTTSPTFQPSASTETPTPRPSPVNSPTNQPTNEPTISPTFGPSISPTISPTDAPTNQPTNEPTISPTFGPSISPTDAPTNKPTVSPQPSVSPTNTQTNQPTVSTKPSVSPVNSPTNKPISPISAVTKPTTSPSNYPTAPTETEPVQSSNESTNDGSESSDAESNSTVNSDSNNDKFVDDNDNILSSILDTSGSMLYIIIGVLVFFMICCIVTIWLCHQHQRHKAMVSFQKARKSTIASATSKSQPNLEKLGNLASVISASTIPKIDGEKYHNTINTGYPGMGGTNPEDVEWSDSSSSSDNNGDEGGEGNNEEDAVVNIISITTINKELQAHRASVAPHVAAGIATPMGPTDADLDRVVYDETKIHHKTNSLLKVAEDGLLKEELDDDDDILLGIDNTIGENGNNNKNPLDENMFDENQLNNNKLNRNENMLMDIVSDEPNIHGNIVVNVPEGPNNDDNNVDVRYRALSRKEIRDKNDAKFGVMLGDVNMGHDLMMDDIVNEMDSNDEDASHGITPGGDDFGMTPM